MKKILLSIALVAMFPIQSFAGGFSRIYIAYHLEGNSPQACDVLQKNYLALYDKPGESWPVRMEGASIPFSRQYPTFPFHLIAPERTVWRNDSTNDLVINGQKGIATLEKASLSMKLENNVWSSTMHILVVYDNSDQICIYEGIQTSK